MEINIGEKISGWLQPAIHNNQYPSEWYAKRIEIIDTIVGNLSTSDAIDLLRYYLGMAESHEISEIDLKIQGGDLAFDISNTFLNKLLVGICLVKILHSSSSEADAVSLGFSTYTFQQTFVSKSENQIDADLRVSVSNYLKEECAKVRKINDGFEKLEESSKKDLSLATLKKSIDSETDETDKVLTGLVDSLTKIQSEVAEKLNKIINSFNTEASNFSNQIAISREETNFLWWLFGEFSRDLNEPLKNFDSAGICLLLGKEAADLTEFLPGHPSAKAFIHRGIKTVASQVGGKPLNGETLIPFTESIEIDLTEWEKDWVMSQEVTRVLELCPFHRAIRLRMDTENNAWRKVFDAKSSFKSNYKFPALDLAYQLYQERLLVRASSL